MWFLIPGIDIFGQLATVMKLVRPERYETEQAKQSRRSSLNRSIRPLSLGAYPKVRFCLLEGYFYGPAPDKEVEDLKRPQVLIRAK